MEKLAVVTGASSGIGESYAQQLAASGCNLMVIARRRDRLDALAASITVEHGVDVQIVQADLADRADLARVCAQVASLSVELLVNNAALAHYKPFIDLSPEQADELLDLNMRAPV